MCLSGRLPLLGVCVMSVSVLSSVPSVHGGASSGEVHQPTHQLVEVRRGSRGAGPGGGRGGGWRSLFCLAYPSCPRGALGGRV